LVDGQQVFSRPVASRRPTRSRCSRTPPRWWTRPTKSSTRSYDRSTGERVRRSGEQNAVRLGFRTRRRRQRISGERCSPHPHVFSDRLIRPGDPAFFDILHSFNGYRTCYYRTFAVGSASVAQRDAYTKCRELVDSAISIVKPGTTTADVVSLWPRRRSSASPTKRRRSVSSTVTVSDCQSGSGRSSVA